MKRGDRVVARRQTWCPSCTEEFPTGTTAILSGVGIDARFGYVAVTFEGHPHPTPSSIKPMLDPAVERVG